MSLLVLPAELVQRIASYCAGDDILTLSSTSRYMRHCCFDRVVLQASFDHYTPKTAAALVPSKKNVVALVTNELRRRQVTSDEVTWVRLSAAAARLDTVVDELETLLAGYETVALEGYSPPSTELLQETKDLLEILSTLTVLGFSQINSFATTAALTGLASVVQTAPFWVDAIALPVDIAFHARLLFCVATGLLNTPVLNNMAVLRHRLEQHLASRRRRPRPGDDVDLDAFAARDATWLGRQTLALLVQAVLIWNLRAHPGSRVRGDLPLARLMPWQPAASDPAVDGALRPIPLAFSNAGPARARRDAAARHDWEAWAKGTANMLAASVTQGEWYGYRSGSTARNDVEDMPMRNVRFAIVEWLTVEGVLKVRAEGCEDGDGPCRLEGRVWTEDVDECGHFYFRREGEGGAGAAASLQFWGSITPLGMSGFCGGAGGEIGLVWLWKKEWMDETGGGGL